LAENPTEEGLQEVVRNVFGFPGFRGNQAAVVQAVLRGRSTLAIMPTGDPVTCMYPPGPLVAIVFGFSRVRAKLPIPVAAPLTVIGVQAPTKSSPELGETKSETVDT